MSGEEERGFKVQDRRRFAAQAESGAKPDDEKGGEAAPERVTIESLAAGGGQEQEGASGEAKAQEAKRAEAGGEVEAITFSTLVISLSTQALMHLGEIPDPISGKVAKNVAGARQVIDMLGVLREKTQGNLERAEQQLLDGMLYDLRMKYVEVVRR